MSLSNRTDAAEIADCHADCVHYQPVSGACGHRLRQVLVSDFLAHPGESCPVYRADE